MLKIKKLASALLCAAMLFGLAACGSVSYRAEYNTGHTGSTAAGGEGGAYPDIAADGYEPGIGGEIYPSTGAGGYFIEPYDIYTGGERYLGITENRFITTREEEQLTFSLKVDSASYTNAMRYLSAGEVPPADAVRVEEFINYFRYDTPLSFSGGVPFAVYTEVGPSIFGGDNMMAFVRVKTPDIDKEELPPSNLVFLVDTSGSMYSADKLPLLVDSIKLLVEALDENDMVSLVTYASGSSVLLDSMSGADKQTILTALDSLSAGGSTAGADGINTAYEIATKNYMENGNNRVILATDGDFNVGISSVELLEDFIASKRDTGVYLSVLGFGTGNIRDDIMETLAAKGNGSYSYINTLGTAQKVLVEELAANLFTIADDVKAQIDFNPAMVASYRLVGYENRLLANEDFEDDSVDAGEIGVGTDVVMMFEFTLAEGWAVQSGNLFTVNIRYKNPGESESRLVQQAAGGPALRGDSSTDFGFASAVAAFGHLLRSSEYANEATLEDIIRLAASSLGTDEGRYRLEFLSMLYDYEKVVK